MTTTPSVLQQIQSTIFRFTRMLSSVLQLDVEIVDADLIRVAGTGPYAKLTGQKLSSSARLLKHVIEAGVEKSSSSHATTRSVEAARNKVDALNVLSSAFPSWLATTALESLA